MSGEATLTPDDGSEEIVIGKGDQVGFLKGRESLTILVSFTKRKTSK